MAPSLRLGSLALLLAGVEGVRFSRKRIAVNATVGSRTTRNIDIDSNGNSATREYSYFVPEQCSDRQCPMLLEFHGQSGSIPNGVGYDGEAASFGFVVVYLHRARTAQIKDKLQNITNKR